MFFLEVAGCEIPAIHHSLGPLEGHEDDSAEDYLENTEGMSSLERAMLGFVAAGAKVYDVPFTTYKCNTVEDACIASLHFLITHGYCVKKCENCGNYFVPKRSDAKYCDRASGHL